MRNDTQNLTDLVKLTANQILCLMLSLIIWKAIYNIEVNYKKKKRCDNYYYMNCLGQLWVRVNVVLDVVL